MSFNFDKEGTKELISFIKTIKKRDVLMFLAFFGFFYYMYLSNKNMSIQIEVAKKEKATIDSISKIVKKDIANNTKDSTVIDSVIGPLLRRDIFGEYVDEDPLDEFVQEFCITYKCSYVNVNLFHNGLITESGYHCKKMSCVSEGIEPGRLPLIHNLQNWVIKPFKYKFRVIKKTGSIYIPNLLVDEDPYFRVTIPRIGVKSVYYVSLYDYRYIDKYGNPHFIGFVSYCWHSKTNFSEGDLVAMKSEIDRIQEFVIDEEKKIR